MWTGKGLPGLSRFKPKTRTALQHPFDHLEKAEKLVDRAVAVKCFAIQARISTKFWLEIRCRRNRKRNFQVRRQNARLCVARSHLYTFNLYYVKWDI